jgi:hypothetical protein
MLHTLLEVIHGLFVLVAQESDGDTGLPSTSSSTDTMHILLDGRCHLPIDDAGDVGYIDTTSGLRGDINLPVSCVDRIESLIRCSPNR